MNKTKVNHIVTYIVKLFMIYLFFHFFSSSAQIDSLVSIRGNVSTSYGYLEDVNIIIKGTGRGTKTDKKGNFSVYLTVGDTLSFSHVGMKTFDFIYRNKEKKLMIEMIPLSTQLEGVTVTGKDKLDTYGAKVDKPKKFISIFGEENLEKKGYAVDYVKGSSLNLAQPSLAAALVGKVPNLRLSQNKPGVVLRSNGSMNGNNNAIWEVDGVIYEGFPPRMDLTNIKDVFIIKSLAGTSKYGTLGAGGVIVVHTYSGSAGFDVTEKKSKSTNLQLYKNDAKVFEISKLIVPNDKNFQAVAESLGDDIVALRELAYKYQASGKNQKALLLFRMVRSIIPEDHQATRDVAYTLWRLGKPLRAWSTYKYLLNSNEGKFPTDLEMVLFNEMERLFVTEKIENIRQDSFKISDNFNKNSNQTKRILIEWASPELEVLIEMVNPNGQVFSEHYGPHNNMAKGVLREFFLDNTIPGGWLINIKSLNGIAAIVKITVHNDWFSNRPKPYPVHVINLQENDTAKYEVLRLQVNDRL